MHTLLRTECLERSPRREEFWSRQAGRLRSSNGDRCMAHKALGCSGRPVPKGYHSANDENASPLDDRNYLLGEHGQGVCRAGVQLNALAGGLLQPTNLCQDEPQPLLGIGCWDVEYLQAAQ